MSKFCGKCDLYDCEVVIHGERYPNYWENLKLYMYHKDCEDAEKIEINSAKDLVLYYPFIECSSGGSGSVRSVFINELSSITKENYELLEFYKQGFVKFYNKCKRKKVSYIPEEAFNEVVWSKDNRSDLLELAKRVGEKKNRADYRDLI